MLRYLDRTQIKSQILKPKQSISLKEKVWLDLLEPTKTEKALVEKQLGIKIPTREDMREIELSSRLYHKKGAYFMTVTMLNQSDSSNPTLDPVTFILTDQQLITIRYIEPQAFNLFNLHAEKLKSQHRNPISLLIELLDAAVERLADTLELVGHRLDDYSDTIFRKEVRTKKHDYKQLMLQIGPIGDLNTQTQESLITFNRVLTYLMQAVGSKLNKKKTSTY